MPVAANSSSEGADWSKALFRAHMDNLELGMMDTCPILYCMVHATKMEALQKLGLGDI